MKFDGASSRYAGVSFLFFLDYAVTPVIRSERRAMAAQSLKTKPKLFHATVLVTRAEEWCVEAETAEQAELLLAAGQGHRCHYGDSVHLEVQQIEE
jgi:hypothetical protein